MASAAPTGIARHTLVYAAGIGLQRGLSILVLPAVTRSLVPAEVGVAGAALAVAGLLSIVLGLGFSFAVVRTYYDEDPEAAEGSHWAMLLRVQLALALGLAVVAWATGPLWSGMFADVAWGGALQAAVVLALAQAAQSSALGVLRAARRVVAFAAVVLTQVGVGALGAVVLAARDGAAGMVAGLAAGSVAAALLGLVLTHRRAVWSRPSVRAGLALSLPFVGHMLAMWVMSLSDRVLIERFVGLEDLASYHLAYAIASLPVLATDAVQAAWVPHYYGLPEAERRSLPGRVAVPATTAVIATAAAVVLAAPAAARVLAPAEYDVPMAVVALVVATTFVRVAYLLGFAALSDAKDSRSIALASGLGATLNFGLNLVAIPVWGIEGAAATTLAAYGLTSVLVVRRAAARASTEVGLDRLAPLWAAGVAVTVAAGALPDGPAGWAVRAGLLAVALGVARRAQRAVEVASRPTSPTT